MESCRNNCVVLLALQYKRQQYEEMKQKNINESWEVIDTDSYLLDESVKKEYLKTREQLMRKADNRIDELSGLIDKAVEQCDPGVKYSRSQEIGTTVLKCEGIDLGMLKIYIN